MTNYSSYAAALKDHEAHIADGGYDKTCPDCEGTGQGPSGLTPCLRCNGIGVVAVSAPRHPVPSQTRERERYIRINIEKNSKGYNYETTVSFTTTGSAVELTHEIVGLLRDADAAARIEIERRTLADQPAASVLAIPERLD